MINLDQITFIITTFKSEKIIYDCLNELPSVSPKIIIENSGNNILKTDLENQFQNLECYIMNHNVGYGTANNIGILGERGTGIKGATKHLEYKPEVYTKIEEMVLAAEDAAE